MAELHRDQHFLFHAEAEPAVFHRNGEAEQAEFAHFRDDGIRHAVFLGDLRLDRHAFLAHEAANRFQQLLERFGIE